MNLYEIARVVLRILYTLLFRLKAYGVENVPREGGVLICSNHISVLDPPTLGIYVPRRLHYMAKSELFKFKPFAALITALGAFPVKRGGVSKEAIKTSLQLLRDGHAILMFPEGTRNSDASSAKRGAALLAIRSGATVVPCRIVGGYRLFRRTYVIYGPPVDLSPYADGTDGEALDQATELIMQRIRELQVG
ncbi:1-acyl-sn-glycerol-3-phosphate acyltransferase [Thermobacillus composti KWC4]|uniref:1-acyl-sn-glycerol-3-phosphate acyltransferase n=1 Tax=Thermobacillus composti (strain DSM 18247 / JCM 13945 / KWC4) TaxID=717605 RepID=L0ECJ5_THECK|nr:lysophospholipid acyltransferase family protein [Thermobacillus composti]AGA58003.1 1-acyl-sn-glycerol-3-phosphate acyltransferase [Thermobacillus composti KWC4]